MVNLTLRLLHPPGGGPPYPIIRKVGWLQSQSGYSGAETKHIQTVTRRETSISY